jgi:hypothetical protein
MLTEWMNEECLEHPALYFLHVHATLSLSPSFSLWPVNRVHTLSSPVRERERDKERKREREKEKEGGRVREWERERVRKRERVKKRESEKEREWER